MTISIRVIPKNGQFTAAVVGDPKLCAVRPTREEAVSALQQDLQEMMNRGELLTYNLEPQGLMALFGKYKDDPMLKEICRKAYAARDAEKVKVPRVRRVKKVRSK